jgi:hypothetical protein
MADQRSTLVPQRRGTASVHLRTGPARSRLSKVEAHRFAYAALQEEARLDQLAASLRIEAIVAGRERALEVSELPGADPLDWDPVRRPTSWTEKVNRTTIFVVKARGPVPPYATWAESLSEADHLRDFLYGRPDRLLVTQVLRLTWKLDGFALTHYPDVLVWEGDERLLCDVTSGRSLDAPQTLAWELSARLCEELGWSYEVRLPMSRQRSLNLRAADYCAEVDRSTVTLAENILASVPERRSLHRLLTEHRDTGASVLKAVLHLLANGLLFCDLERPLTRASWLSHDPAHSHAPVPTAERTNWLTHYTHRPDALHG